MIVLWRRKEKTRAFAGAVMSVAFSHGKVATTYTSSSASASSAQATRSVISELR